MGDLTFDNKGSIPSTISYVKHRVHYKSRHIGTIYRNQESADYFDESVGEHGYTREQLLAIAAELE